MVPCRLAWHVALEQGSCARCSLQASTCLQPRYPTTLWVWTSFWSEGEGGLRAKSVCKQDGSNRACLNVLSLDRLRFDAGCWIIILDEASHSVLALEDVLSDLQETTRRRPAGTPWRRRRR
eukprot:358057-Chlamydomonas_euryale.AAC.7